MSNKMYINKS